MNFSVSKKNNRQTKSRSIAMKRDKEYIFIYLLFLMIKQLISVYLICFNFFLFAGSQLLQIIQFKNIFR